MMLLHVIQGVWPRELGAATNLEVREDEELMTSGDDENDVLYTDRAPSWPSQVVPSITPTAGPWVVRDS